MTARAAEIVDPKQAFIKGINAFAAGGTHHPWRIFADFCTLAALTLANVVDKNEAREALYLQTVKPYTPDEANRMAALLAHVTMGLEEGPHDFLGPCFLELELQNHWRGQFFTPFEVSRLMAGMLMHDAPAMIEAQGFIRVSDPACGSGCMPIACAAVLLAQNINPQTTMHITCQDIDQTAAFMCLIQLSLLGLPAVVIVGDTIRMEQREVYATPAHHLGFWDAKLRWRRESEAIAKSHGASVDTIVVEPACGTGQMLAIAEQDVARVIANPPHSQGSLAFTQSSKASA